MPSCPSAPAAASPPTPSGTAPANGTAFGVQGEGLLGLTSAVISVGPLLCPDVRHFTDTYLECHGLAGSGTDHLLTVAVGLPPLTAAPGVRFTLSFADPCSGKAGFWAGRACDVCQPDYYGPQCARRCAGCGGHGRCRDGVDGDGVCTCNADAARGHWVGAVCTDCYPGYAGPNCTIACPGAGSASGGVCAGHGMCKGAVAGSALCICVPPWGGIGCDIQCPTDDMQTPCSGHGRCFRGASGTGQCMCDSGAGTGHWVGAACERCAEGWTGSACAGSCPGTPVACSGHGRCIWEGDRAVCDCDPGFAGRACAAACPVDAQTLRVCSGRGTCGVAPSGEAVCTCDAADATGHWGGAACGACLAGYGGPSCTLRCPADANGTTCSGECSVGWAGALCDTPCEGSPTTPLCSGHGQCHPHTGMCLCFPGWRSIEGAVCGAACPTFRALECAGHGVCNASAHCECQAGYGGPTCAILCPRHAGRLCGGRGMCTQERAHCVCDHSAATGYWGGEACAACAGGYYGAACTKVCVGGITVGKTCRCLLGWFGLNCTEECPGGAANPCSGHGVCGSTTGGACARNRQCPTGESGLPCSGHGHCRLGQAECHCDDSADGHWGGRTCNDCIWPYFGLHCTFRCPEDAAGVVCGGHGICARNDGCMCAADPAEGYWAGAACSSCAPGYYGTDCQGSCRGVCSPCNGHGACHDGREGNGTCTADPAQGHWDPVFACGDCLPGYYGPLCRRQCPGGAALPCRGHGVCAAGVAGSGACACAAGPGAGFWAGATCSVCVRGYFGPRCTAACPGRGAAGAACSGAGVCDDGVTGTGLCRCAAGAVGPACEFACPRAAGLPCNGRGACLLAGGGGAAVCRCLAHSALGHWAGLACAECAPGYWGTNCTGPCPGGVPVPCAGHGVCSDGQTGSGRCACASGYAGEDCALQCPGLSAGTVCSAHGSCDAAG